jgi:L-2-hydroxyglutarate oxidase LhgO
MGIEKVAGGYKITVKDGCREFSFITRILVNCAGLYCDKVAGLAGVI